MNKDLKATSLPWKQIACMWVNYFTVPSRISPQELDQYKKWMKKKNTNKKHLKALVLGATPEIRDALFDLGYKVYSIDINRDMFLAMHELLKDKNPNEILITENWLDNSLENNFFDVIAGDAILPNIPWSQRSNLLSIIKKLLKPNGVFLTRAFCIPDKKTFKDVKEVFEHFSKKQDPIKQCALEMVLELQILAYNPKDHLGSFSKAKDLLEEYHKKKGNKFKNKRLQKIHDIVYNFWCKDFLNKVFVYAYRDEEEKSYKKYFKIVNTFEASDHSYSKITPMYFLQK